MIVVCAPGLSGAVVAGTDVAWPSTLNGMMSVPRTSRRSATSKQRRVAVAAVRDDDAHRHVPAVRFVDRPTDIEDPDHEVRRTGRGSRRRRHRRRQRWRLTARLGLAERGSRPPRREASPEGAHPSPRSRRARAAFAVPSRVGANTIDSSQLAPGASCVPVHDESTSWKAVTSSMPMLVIRSGRLPAVIRTVWASDRFADRAVEKPQVSRRDRGGRAAGVDEKPGDDRDDGEDADGQRDEPLSRKSSPLPSADVKVLLDFAPREQGPTESRRGPRGSAAVALNPGRSPIRRRISRARVRLSRASVRRPSTASCVPT